MNFCDSFTVQKKRKSALTHFDKEHWKCCSFISLSWQRPFRGTYYLAVFMHSVFWQNCSIKAVVHFIVVGKHTVSAFAISVSTKYCDIIIHPFPMTAHPYLCKTNRKIKSAFAVVLCVCVAVSAIVERGSTPSSTSSPTAPHQSQRLAKGEPAECPAAATPPGYEDTETELQRGRPHSVILCKEGGNMESHPAKCNSKHKLGTRFRVDQPQRGKKKGW